MVRDTLTLLLLIGLGMACDRMPAGPSPVPGAGVCSSFPPQAMSPYVLPYPVGERATVARSTEHGGAQRFAVDFFRPIGSAVLAARAGRVIETESRWRDDDHQFGHENHVFIEHHDGSVGRYFHLTVDGVLVRVGQAIAQGQVVGRSGHSGNSTAPHLHLDIVGASCEAPWPEDLGNPSCQETRPLTFVNTSAHPCGVIAGSTYVAQP